MEKILPTTINGHKIHKEERKISPLVKLLGVIAVIQILLCCLWFIISSISSIDLHYTNQDINNSSQCFNYDHNKYQSHLNGLEIMCITQYP